MLASSSRCLASCLASCLATCLAARGHVRLSAANQPLMDAIICRLPTPRNEAPLSRTGERRTRVISQALHKMTGRIPPLGVRNLIPPRAEESKFSAKALISIQILSRFLTLAFGLLGERRIRIFRPYQFFGIRIHVLPRSMCGPSQHNDETPTPWPASGLQHISSCVRRACVRSDVSRNCFERLSNIFTCRPVSE